MWYALLVDADARKGVPAKPVPARVIAHNLDHAAAEELKGKLRASTTVEGESLAMIFAWGYETLHTANSPDHCPECGDLIGNHHREILQMLTEEAAKRARSW